MPATSTWSGTPSIKGSSESLRLALLTFSVIGLQLTWGLEATYCTPYLLSLGLTKSKTSLVWIAGPLSGLLMQPIVGAITDRSTSRWGRRRPFMIGGSIIMSFSMILLGWTSEIVGVFVAEGPSKQNLTIVVAVLAIYLIDFAINAVQSCSRSLIVDTLPIPQQQAGSAWAARMAASGHVIGYVIGTLDLVAILPTWLGGDTQFKKMCLIATVGLWFAIGITCYAVKERVLLSSPDQGKPIWLTLKHLWTRIFNLPPRIQAICWCQFWAWIGWFPFLFYSTTWVGETYYRYEHPSPQAGSPEDHDALGNIGRLGSLSLVIFSLITFASSVGLPYLISSPDKVTSIRPSRFTPRPPPTLGKQVQRILLKLSETTRPDLVSAWTYSHLAFAAIMFWAPFVRSLAFATTLVALCGVPWAVTCWAPFAEMGVEINRLATGSAHHSTSVNGSAMLASGDYSAVRPSVDDDDDDIELNLHLGRDGHNRLASGSSQVLRLSHPDDEADSSPASSTGELAGIYLGVLNVYTTLPQFVGTAVSWVVFSLLEPKRTDVDGDSPEHHKYLDLSGVNAIAVCLFVGSVCAVAAAEATRRLKRLG